MARHIVIVEDEATIRHNYEDALRRYGYRVTGFGDRPSALAALQRRLPDLVIIDVGLGDDVRPQPLGRVERVGHRHHVRGIDLGQFRHAERRYLDRERPADLPVECAHLVAKRPAIAAGGQVRITAVVGRVRCHRLFVVFAIHRVRFPTARRPSHCSGLP